MHRIHEPGIHPLDYATSQSITELSRDNGSIVVCVAYAAVALIVAIPAMVMFIYGLIVAFIPR